MSKLTGLTRLLQSILKGVLCNNLSLWTLCSGGLMLLDCGFLCAGRISCDNPMDGTLPTVSSASSQCLFPLHGREWNSGHSSSEMTSTYINVQLAWAQHRSCTEPHNISVTSHQFFISQNSTAPFCHQTGHHWHVRMMIHHEDASYLSLCVFEYIMDHCELWLLGQSGLWLTFYALETSAVLFFRTYSKLSQLGLLVPPSITTVFHIQVLFFVLPTGHDRTCFHFCFSSLCLSNQNQISKSCIYLFSLPT